MKPIEIRRRDGSALVIKWEDGSEQVLDSSVLRKSCPCASCRKEREEAPRTALSIVKEGAERSSEIVQVRAVGNYAVGILWGDGHDAGIYSFDLLLTLTAEE